MIYVFTFIMIKDFTLLDFIFTSFCVNLILITIIVMVKLNLLAPTMKRGRKKRSNLEKELIGIGLSTRDAERFTMVIDKEINGIASSAGSFDGNETAALDIEKL